jgi:hypothetical protein
MTRRFGLSTDLSGVHQSSSSGEAEPLACPGRTWWLDAIKSGLFQVVLDAKPEDTGFKSAPGDWRSGKQLPFEVGNALLPPLQVDSPKAHPQPSVGIHLTA